MASELLPKAWPPYRVEPWSPDDTDGNVSGTNLHQTTITNLRLGINLAALLVERLGIAWRVVQ